MKFWTKATVAVALVIAGPIGWVSIDACRGLQAAQPQPEVRSFILRGAPLADMVNAVSEVGGAVSHKLAVVDAVSAQLSFGQLSRLSDINADIHVAEDGRVGARSVPGTRADDSDFCLTAERAPRGGAGFSSSAEMRGLSGERSIALQLGLKH